MIQAIKQTDIVRTYEVKYKGWKFATTVIVMLLIFNPELFQLALFIDAVGLEVFLLLLEIQILATIGYIYRESIKPFFSFISSTYQRICHTTPRDIISRYTTQMVVHVFTPGLLIVLIAFSGVLGGIL